MIINRTIICFLMYVEVNTSNFQIFEKNSLNREICKQMPLQKIIGRAVKILLSDYNTTFKIKWISMQLFYSKLFFWSTSYEVCRKFA